MSEWLLFDKKHPWEQCDKVVTGINLPEDFKYCYFFSGDKQVNNHPPCISIDIEGEGHRVKTSYFIGVDWLGNHQFKVSIEPKLNVNEQEQETNYLEMLFSILRHPQITNLDNLYEIKWNETPIVINQKQDFLTPLLVAHFLRIIKEIVRKGLKKSYYKIERNLNSRVKGKVLIGKTIKSNLLKNKTLYTYCSYDEFGLNGIENRLLKKALLFVQRYMPTLKNRNSSEYITEVLNYSLPAFENVSEEVNLHDIKHSNFNAFYKEYSEGIKLAKLILRRFGYNITNAEEEYISTPPFWIDMSKLFEMYVYVKLLDRRHDIEYQFHGNYGYPDYLLLEPKMVIDAKYKTYYKGSFGQLSNGQRDSIASDIRQVSGYARDKKIMGKLRWESKELIDCLIIYPDITTTVLNLDAKTFKDIKIDEFEGFYKIGVPLPKL